MSWLWLRFAHNVCFVSHLTCTKTPGRNGHFGGLLGTSDAVDRGEDASFGSWADRTLFGFRFSVRCRIRIDFMANRTFVSWEEERKNKSKNMEHIIICERYTIACKTKCSPHLDNLIYTSLSKYTHTIAAIVRLPVATMPNSITPNCIAAWWVSVLAGNGRQHTAIVNQITAMISTQSTQCNY